MRGLTVEEHLARLREGLLPLAERYGRVLREALAALETLRAQPSRAVERSKPFKVSVMLGRQEKVMRPQLAPLIAISRARAYRLDLRLPACRSGGRSSVSSSMVA